MSLGIVCVDDGSTVVNRRDSAVLSIHLMDLGQGSALKAGPRYTLERTSAARTVTFDADGQHRAENVPLLAEPTLAGRAEVVFATRFKGHEENVPVLQRLVLKTGARISNRGPNLEPSDAHDDVRAFSRRASG